MISVLQKVADAWMQTLKDQLANGVKVYPVSTLNREGGNYVLLSIESDTEQPLKSAAWNKVVMRVKIVTRFPTIVDQNIAFGIDNEIEQLVRGIPGSQLVKQDDIQILEVTREQSIPLDYQTSEYKVYEINTRYANHIFQKL